MTNSAADKLAQLGLSRRTILNSAVSVAVMAIGTPAFALTGNGTVTGGDRLDIDPLALIDEPLAHALVGSDFAVSSDTVNAELRLAKVAGDLITAKKAQEVYVKFFAMEFEVLSTSGVLTQDTYHVSHSKLGTFDLLLVPHTSKSGKRVLVATFSRLK